MTETPSGFLAKLEAAQQRSQTLLCVGLDPDPARFPAGFARDASAIRAFNRAIVEATSDLACCYKPNLGFYLPHGQTGLAALAALREDVPAEIPLLLDAKFGDIDSTSVGYASAVFDLWGFDAVTANPYLGHDSLAPFLGYAGRGVFVLARTSNPGSGLLQERELAGGGTVAEAVARAAVEWSTTSAAAVGLVAGATWPQRVAELRALAPALPLLIPGVGAQAGDLAAAVRAGLDARGAGILVNASRAITYASSGADFQDAARAAADGLRRAIQAARQPAG